MENPDGPGMGGSRRAGPNLTSVMERNDLDEFLAIAELSERDFTAERRGAVVVSLGGDGGHSGVGVDGDSARRDEARRLAETARAQLTHADKLKVPRRPPWTRETSPEQLDANERRCFLEWRRALAAVEEDERLTLTPFEKNLEIWRQLWRVCERSDVVVQVVDARDPLFYRCPDLEAYVREIDGDRKKTMLLLNKADLLSPQLRAAWSDHFDEIGVEHLWWSAKAASEEVEAEERAAKTDWMAEEAATAAAIGGVRAGEGVLDDEDESESESDEDAGAPSARTRRGRSPANANASIAVAGKSDVLTRAQLLDVIERACETVAGEGARERRKDGRVVVGMVGYPNVGKSSTVNALVAAKKTGVSSTPGKTKHFQTLNLGEGLMLADCPGLVFPSFTASRAELVCNGVLPVDRLTDVREPVAVVAARIPREAFEATYKVKLPLPALHEDQKRRATAGEMLRAYSAARGLTVQHGRPDEQRAGRAILKDFTQGKLLHCVGPPGYVGPLGIDGGGGAIGGEDGDGDLLDEDGVFNDRGRDVRGDGDGGDGGGGGGDGGEIEDDPLAAQLLREMMLELGGLDGHGNVTKEQKEKAKIKRAEHKFQKKGEKKKGRIKHAGVGEDDTAGGNGFRMGRRGGMMPASVQATVRSAVTDEM